MIALESRENTVDAAITPDKTDDQDHRCSAWTITSDGSFFWFGCLADVEKDARASFRTVLPYMNFNTDLELLRGAHHLLLLRTYEAKQGQAWARLTNPSPPPPPWPPLRIADLLRAGNAQNEIRVTASRDFWLDKATMTHLEGKGLIEWRYAVISVVFLEEPVFFILLTSLSPSILSVSKLMGQHERRKL